MVMACVTASPSPHPPYSSETGIRPCSKLSDTATWVVALCIIFEAAHSIDSCCAAARYLLDQVAGVSCPTLWDNAKPLAWTYGFYQDILCKPFPKNY